MKRYWITASSKNNPLHHHDGDVVFAPKEGENPRCYLMDLSVPNTSMVVPRRYLAPWHDYTPSHEYCYCLRGIHKEST